MTIEDSSRSYGNATFETCSGNCPSANVLVDSSGPRTPERIALDYADPIIFIIPLLAYFITRGSLNDDN